MKRYIALILSLLLLSAVAACKKAPQSSENSSAATTADSSAESSLVVDDSWVNSITSGSSDNESASSDKETAAGSSSRENDAASSSDNAASVSAPTSSEYPSSVSSNNSESRPAGSSASSPSSNSRPSSNSNSSSDTSSGSNTPTPSVGAWDGSIATAFYAGNGSSSSPYIIRSGSELAKLAYDVNRGISYAGKVFMLGLDIDLAGREWTPIGNGKYAFEGVFIGCDRTIKNISVTKQTTYYRSSDGVDFGYAGLFGYAKNAEFDSITLDGVKIKVDPSLSCDYTRIGGLVGSLSTTTESAVRDIKVKNMKVETDFSSTYLTVGGVVGYISTNESAIFAAERISAELTIKDKANDYTSYLGGVFGYLSNKGSSIVTDFASYATVYWSDTDDGDNFAGAIGALNNHKGTVKLTNAFSELKINRKYNISSSPISRAGAVIGTYYADANVKETNIFKNLFGYVASVYNHYSPAMVLYGSYINDDSLTATNCTGAMSLPENSGFKSSVWNLSNLSHPTLK